MPSAKLHPVFELGSYFSAVSAAESFNELIYLLSLHFETHCFFKAATLTLKDGMIHLEIAIFLKHSYGKPLYAQLKKHFDLKKKNWDDQD